MKLFTSLFVVFTALAATWNFANAQTLDQENFPAFTNGISAQFGQQTITAGISGILARAEFHAQLPTAAVWTIQTRVLDGLNGVELGSISTEVTTTSGANVLLIFDFSSENLFFESGEVFAIDWTYSCTNSSGSPISCNLVINYNSDSTLYPDGNMFCDVCGGGSGTVLGDALFRTFVGEPVPSVEMVDIDIKPGSDPNSINLCGVGVIPVAIAGSDTFMVSDVIISTLRLGDGTPDSGSEVKMAGRSGKDLCSIKDVIGDGNDDLVCQFVTVDLALDEGAIDATVLGSTASVDFAGTDAVNIVKFCDNL